MPINLAGVSYTYQAGTPFEKEVLFDISLNIADGEFLGIIGPTQAGKTTLAQHCNALLIPKKGKVLVDGLNTADKKTDLVKVRQKVGYVFQNPEHQLFKTTVGEDIAFGPANQKCSKTEIERRIREAMELVGLDYYQFFCRDVFALSGGQKRRAAIAGVLACRPKVLVLDDVTAGLDPRGRETILAVIRNLHREKKITIIFISSSMDEVARLAERVVVLHRGRIVLEGGVRTVFAQVDRLKAIGLEPPQITEIMLHLNQKGIAVPLDALNLDEALEAVIAALKRAGAGAPWS
ncbi:MAG: energy-coupling factor transporter ATPase [Bacillota bacterium]